MLRIQAWAATYEGRAAGLSRAETGAQPADTLASEGTSEPLPSSREPSPSFGPSFPQLRRPRCGWRSPGSAIRRDAVWFPPCSTPGPPTTPMASRRGDDTQALPDASPRLHERRGGRPGRGHQEGDLGDRGAVLRWLRAPGGGAQPVDDLLGAAFGMRPPGAPARLAGDVGRTSDDRTDRDVGSPTRDQFLARRR